jgi:hypothetical protein
MLTGGLESTEEIPADASSPKLVSFACEVGGVADGAELWATGLGR